jgi:hypothetical protein
MIGELPDRERDQLVRLNAPGQRHQEHENKTVNDSFHGELAAGSKRRVQADMCLL